MTAARAQACEATDRLAPALLRQPMPAHYQEALDQARRPTGSCVAMPGLTFSPSMVWRSPARHSATQSSYEGRDRARAKLVGCTVRDQHARHDCDLLDDFQAVLKEGLASLHEIDDELRQTHEWGQLHRTLNIDDLGLDAFGSKMGSRCARVFRRNARYPAERAASYGASHNCATSADPEVERCENIAFALAEDITTTYSQVRRTIFDVGGNIVRLEKQELHTSRVSHQRSVVGEQSARIDADRHQELGQRLQNTALWHRDHQRPVAIGRANHLRVGYGAHAPRPPTREIVAPSPPSFSPLPPYPR